jgi:hypothetical protein
MASKSKATPQKEEVPEKEDPEAPPDSPLLDLPDAAIRRIIKQAKKRLRHLQTAQISAALWRDHLRADRGYIGRAEQDGH